MRTMRSIRRAARSLALLLAGIARAEELTGTPYTMVWRGSALAQPPVIANNPNYRTPLAQPTSVVLRVVDLATRRELARTTFDPRLGGWLFQMPFTGIGGVGNRCLALLDPRNQAIAVRQSSSLDAGVGFRHPGWERELARNGDLNALKSERATVQAQVQSNDAEAARLLAETGLPEGAQPAQCPLAPAPPEPPRPVGAMEPAQATAVAGSVCAWRWERDHGQRVNLGRLFADAGLDADWQTRAEGRTFGEELAELRLPIVGPDLALVLDAAAKGRTFLEHADGVRVLSRTQAACRIEMARIATAARARWQQAVEGARQAPLRAREQCALKLDRVAKLRAAQAAAPMLLAVLDRRIAELAVPPSSDNPQPLHNQTCQP
jgi:hypothetical protein